jgi:hypothetical protein
LIFIALSEKDPTPVKFRCSATRGGKKVSCTVVKGSGVGPRGLQGPRGVTGKDGTNGINGINGATGPTTFTQSPAFVVLVPPAFPTAFSAAGGSYANDSADQQLDDWQGWVASNITTSPVDGTDMWQMPLLSPSQVAGSTAHLGSVQFCIDVSGNSNPAGTFLSDVTVTRASVVELKEPTPASQQAAAFPNPPGTTGVTLIDQALSMTDASNCLTASASTPQAVDPSAYLVLRVTLNYHAQADSTSDGSHEPTSYIWFGRVTTTYTP